VHRNADEIHFARNGTVRGVICIIESAAEGKSAIVGEIILGQAQGLGFGSAQQIGVA
jgi:hypothetical protein